MKKKQNIIDLGKKRCGENKEDDDNKNDVTGIIYRLIIIIICMI